MGIQAPLTNGMGMPPAGALPNLPGAPPAAPAQAPNTGAAGLMTELPQVPPPPFLNASPSSTPLAKSIPLNQPSVDVPPPHMTAPWLYNRAPKAAPTPQQAPTPVAQQPPAQPATPPPAPAQPPAAESPPPEPKTPAPTETVDGSILNDKTIRSLNQRLNDMNEETRSEAAIELFKILDSNPKLADDPTYKPYVDAFMEKIMSDSSPLVRQAGALALQMGRVKNPSTPVRDKLAELAGKTNLYNVESSAAQEILTGLETGTLGQQDESPAGQAVEAKPPFYKSDKTPESGAEPKTAANNPTPEPQSANPAAAGQMPDEAQLAQLLQGLGQATPPSPQGGNPAPVSPAAPANTPPGHRLDITSPQQTPANTAMNPVQASHPAAMMQPGQRLNIQEGPRS